MIFRPGDIVFVMHHDSKISKAIAWFMKSKWSHTAMVIEQTKQAIYLCETSDKEVWIGNLNDYIYDNNCEIEVWRWADAPTKEMQDVCVEAMKNRGKLYGYLQLISFGIRRLLKRFGIKINNLFRQGLVCCAVVMYGYKKSSIKELCELDPESLDTQDFYEIIPSIQLDNGNPRFQCIYKKGTTNG